MGPHGGNKCSSSSLLLPLLARGRICGWVGDERTEEEGDLHFRKTSLSLSLSVFQYFSRPKFPIFESQKFGSVHTLSSSFSFLETVAIVSWNTSNRSISVDKKFIRGTSSCKNILNIKSSKTKVLHPIQQQSSLQMGATQFRRPRAISDAFSTLFFPFRRRHQKTFHPPLPLLSKPEGGRCAFLLLLLLLLPPFWSP